MCGVAMQTALDAACPHFAMFQTIKANNRAGLKERTDWLPRKTAGRDSNSLSMRLAQA